MTFLPIAARELRVAARKASTVWFRVLAALVALLIAAGFLAISLAFETRSSAFGSGLFGTLTWLALAATLGAGLFFTADCLSEEKREGTLGFLFLTDLKGYDVVGGKLLATSLRGSFALLGVFPVLAITLVMGGVTGLQFCKSALALINALFCSLATGLCISSFCRDSQRALGGTFLLLLLVCAGGPILDSFLAASRGRGFTALASLLSPAYVFWASSAWGKAGYWWGLLDSHLLGWGWLSLACFVAPRSWQQRGARVPGVSPRWSHGWKYGNSAVRARRRGKWMEPNPVVWLAARERWQAIALWTLVLLLLSSFVLMVVILPPVAWVFWGQINWLVLVVFYLWAASQAGRFNLEAKRSGLLELILVTPLNGEEIVEGQWRALLRLFGWPVFLVAAVQLAGAILARRSSLGMTAASGLASSPVLFVMSAAAGGATTIGNLVALVWFGMWTGLTSRNASVATLKTILFVQVVPWLGITVASTSIVGLLMFSNAVGGRTPNSTMVLFFPLVIAGLSATLSLAKDAAFVIWARKRLRERFRAEASQQLASSGSFALARSPVSSPPPVLTSA